ncbi:MAG: hypothetical protein JNJ73_18220 [Hyphomonadaceae bacterium]|nr:hypothetical protein [Hyphomonadaceae bacterium]
MPLFARRRLTPGEIALAGGIFADSLDWERVRILQGPAFGVPGLNFNAMVPAGGTILFSRWRAAWDFAEAGLDEQGWLVHELAHCWQAQGGRLLAFAKLSAMGREAYRPPRDAPFAAMNIEAQAEIARLLFLARCGAKCAPFLREELEGLWPVKA